MFSHILFINLTKFILLHFLNHSNKLFLFFFLRNQNSISINIIIFIPIKFLLTHTHFHPIKLYFNLILQTIGFFLIYFYYFFQNLIILLILVYGAHTPKVAFIYLVWFPLLYKKKKNIKLIFLVATFCNKKIFVNSINLISSNKD
jgi:hypothetical protein